MLYERIVDRAERLIQDHAQRYLCGHGRRYDRWVFAFTFNCEENKGRGYDVTDSTGSAYAVYRQRGLASARRATLLIDPWLILADGGTQLPRRPAVVVWQIRPFSAQWWKVDK